HLNAVSDVYNAVFSAWNSTLDCDKIVLNVNFNDFEVLNCNLFSTHVTWQAFALEYAGWIGTSTIGTCMSCNRTATVGLFESVVAVTFNCAGVTFTFRNAANVYFVAV